MISSDAPDWSYWRLVPTVKLFEAVALSLNIDPKRLVAHPAGGRTAGIAIARIPPPQFYRRLDLARRCIGETLPAAKPRYGEEHVTLQSFTKWTTGVVGWDVPPELEALADSMAKSELEEPTHSGVPGRPAKRKHLIDQTPEPAAAELISDAGPIARGSDVDQRQPAEGAAAAGSSPAGAMSPNDAQIEEWIFVRHELPPRRRTSKKLYEAARQDAQLGTFKKADFLAAYGNVYATERHAPPATGWPLQPAYAKRAKEQKSSK